MDAVARLLPAPAAWIAGSGNARKLPVSRA